MSVPRAEAGPRDPHPGAGRGAPLPLPSRAPLLSAQGLRVLVPTPPSRASPAAAPAHARGLAQGGEGRRPRASDLEPVRPDPGSRPGVVGAAGARTAPLPRSPGPSCACRPRRADRGRGDERRHRGGSPGRALPPFGAPAPPPPRASELVGFVGALLIYNEFRFLQDGEGRAAVPSGTGTRVK